MLKHFISILPLLSFTYAQLKLTSDGCVDPSGFDSCMSAATNRATECYSNICGNQNGECADELNCSSSNPDCVSNCVCIAYQEWINCALSSCWNRIYSCEAQQLMITAFQSCEIAVVYPPYFPAPGSAPGSCSCQMELLYDNIRATLSNTNKCLSRHPLVKGNEACHCCGYSKAFSALPAICPTTDPSTLPFYNRTAAISNDLSYFQSQTCSSILSDTDCAADPLDFVLANNGKFYGPDDVPAPGTQSVSNLPGSLSTPISGTSIVWALNTGMVPATAIAASGGSAAASSSSSSSSSSSGGAAASSGTTSAGGSSTASSATGTAPAQSSSTGGVMGGRERATIASFAGIMMAVFGLVVVLA